MNQILVGKKIIFEIFLIFSNVFLVFKILVDPKTKFNLLINKNSLISPNCMRNICDSC